MDPIQRLLAERECERLVTDYCHFTDRGTGQVADLFTEDGVLDVGVNRNEGREAIRAASVANAGAMTMVHVCSNFTVEFDSETTGKGSTYLEAYVAPKAAENPEVRLPLLVGRYHDRFEKTADGWRFKERTVEPVFRRAL